MFLVITSTNKHKIEEIQKIFNFPMLQITSLQQYPKIPPALEDGKTFSENAERKARHYYSFIKQAVIADDSGLVVPALQGQPGILSARYAGEQATYSENNKLLLQNMSALPEKARAAYFVCAVVFFDGRQLICAEGKVDGRILYEARGDNGFGYDPLFYYPPAGKTFAELEAEEKNLLSHRSLALRNLKTKLEKILPNNT
jgi:XTP/dITP diphosphohydrolase